MTSGAFFPAKRVHDLCRRACEDQLAFRLKAVGSPVLFSDAEMQRIKNIAVMSGEDVHDGLYFLSVMDYSMLTRASGFD